MRLSAVGKLHGPGNAGTGIVYEDIYPAEFFVYLLEDLRDRRFVGNVGAEIAYARIAAGVADLDARLRDADDPHRLRADVHLGDGVHPNWRGGERMAEAVMELL